MSKNKATLAMVIGGLGKLQGLKAPSISDILERLGYRYEALVIKDLEDLNLSDLNNYVYMREN